MKRRLSLICSLMLLVGLIAVAATITHGASKSKAKEPYKIGAIFSVTGRAAPLGQPEKETAEMIVEQINAKGGIDGHKIELIVEDDASEEGKAVLAAKKLIESDKVLAVVGPSTSGNTLAIVKQFEESKTPLISCAASVLIVEPVKPYIFNTPQTDRTAVNKILDYLEKKKIKKIAFISDSNAYGQSGRKEIENLAPQRGIEIVAKETFGGEDTDMTAQLTHIKGTDAKAVICWGTNPGPAVVTRNMKQLGMKIPLIQSHGIANKKFIELAGDSANGVILPAGRLIVADQLPDSDPQKKVLLKYIADFNKKYNDLSTFGGHAYDSLHILFAALKKSGPDKVKLRKEIENTKKFVGTGGIFTYSPNDHNGLNANAFVMVTIDKGDWKLMK